MMKLATRSTALQRTASIEHRSRAHSASRIGSTQRRSPVVFVVLAAVLAVAGVTVAERIEDRVIGASIADTPVVTPSNTDTSSTDTSNADPSGTPSIPEAPVTSAVLPSGTMALTLSDGAATITTGVDAPAIELATTTIGDLDLDLELDLERGDVAGDVVIAQADDEVSYDWGDVTEWYRTAPEGIEHGYTIDTPVSDSDELTVTVDVESGTPALVGADTIAIGRAGASTLFYRGLVAFDADGVDLPAEMAVVGGDIELRIDTAGAVYPITIDPIITDAQLVRVGAGPSTLEIAPVADSGRLGTGGGGETVSPCPSGTLLTGLTVYQTSRETNWLRSAIPLCRQVELIEGTATMVGGPVEGSEFGDRLGSLPAPLPTWQTGLCADGSAVTGLSGNAGSLVDNVLLSCNVVNPDGTVGDATGPVGPLGGTGGAAASPVSCEATAFAQGLQGRTGDDIDAIGLQCAQVSVLIDDLTDDEFGWAVDIEGDRMVASAPFAQVDGVDRAGKVYVYTRGVDGVWVPAGAVASPAPEVGGAFGDALALNGNRLAVGESDRVGDQAESGRVWVFETGDSGWNPLGEPISVESSPDAFGASLAWLGNSLVVGAPEAGGGAGAVYITVFDGAWSPPALLQATPGSSPTVGAGDALGYSVGAASSAAGSFIVAGAPGDDNATGANAGAVHIWRETEGGFDPAEKVLAGTDWLATDAVGSAVAIDGNVIVAAGLSASSAGAPTTVRTIDIPLSGPVTSTWSFRQNLVVGVNRGPNDYVDIDDGTIVFRRPGSGSEIQVFQDAGAGFPAQPDHQFVPTQRANGDRIGFSLEIEGLTVVAGAPGDDEPRDAGSVYSFQVPPPVPPTIPPTGLTLDITPSTDSTEVGVDAIDIASLPASVFQGYGGPTAEYARSDLQTIDLRSDTAESTPVAEVTLADLALDAAPVTRALLSTILLSDIPLDGGWSTKLRPAGPRLVEQTISLLDVYEDYPSTVLEDIRLGDLGLQASTLGSISTFAALLAGVPVTQLPFPGSAPDATAFWCGLVADVGLDCAIDFGTAPLTLPVLSFAGVDVEQAEFLGALIDGSTNLSGTPIGQTLLGALDIGAVPLASQPLVPSKSLPSYLPSTLAVPSAFRDVTLGELGQAAPLGALTPADVDLASTAAASQVLDLTHQPDTPLADYSWVAPAAGASLLVTSEAPLSQAVADVPVGDIGLNAPVLSVPLDEIILPNGRALGDYRLVELLGGEAEFGAAPFAASPFAASPFGSAPFAASSIGASPFRASPFRASPFAASPFRASPFAASPFRASAVGTTPFRASPFRASPFRASPFAASTFGVSPFRASPFRASPFRASPFAASPFRASPFGTSPFGASPFRASPFRASSLDNTPFRASPFRASPLSELGLSAPVTAIPLTGFVGGQALGSYRLADLDSSTLLFGLPLEPFVGWVEADGAPVFDCDVIDCRQPNGFTLGEGLEAGALPDDLTLGDVQPGLFGLTLADLVGAHPNFTADALRAFSAALTDADGTPLTLGDAADAGFAPDGIPIELFDAYNQVTISDERLVFSGWRLVDFAGLAVGLDLEDLEAAVADWAATSTLSVGDLTGKIPVAKDGLFDGELWVDTLAVSTLVDAAPGLTVDDIWPLLRPLRLEHLRTGANQPLSITGSAATTTIGSILAGDPAAPAASRLEGLLWGDIVGSAGTDPLPSAAAFTVADVIGGFTGVTLGEFLRAAQPITDQRTEQIDLSAIDLADYATGAQVSFDVDITVQGGNRPQSTRIVVTLPAGSRYVPGSVTIDGFDLDENELAELEPATFGDTLVWQIANLLPDTTYILRFDTRSSERVGTLVTAATASLASVDLLASDSAVVEYREALEPNNTPADARTQRFIDTGQIVLSQISSATDVDIFAFDVNTPGQRIGATLWNLPADYDVTIIGPSSEPLSPTSGRVRESVGDADTSILGGATSSTLSDAGQYQPPSDLAVIARSTSRGIAPENIAPVPTFVEGTYYLVVSPYDGAFSEVPYALRLLSSAPVVAPPVCPTAVTFPNGPGSAPSIAPLPSDVDTLFVINHDRFARQYGDLQADRLVTEIQDLTSALAGDLSDLGLVAGTVDLGADTTLRNVYSAWDQAPCEIALANDVVRETIDVLGDVYDANPGIENVVIVGSDRIIPFARIADRTLVGNEQSYASTFAGDTSSPLYAALQAGTYFSDDPFADSTPTLVNDRALYVAEKSVGRLVETPDEIVGQLRSFVERSGTVRVDSATVAGYDFLADSSSEIADLLEGPVDTPVDASLVRDDWTAVDLEEKFFPQDDSTPGIGVINGHFSHQGTQSALGSAEGNENDALFVGDIGSSDFTGSLLFTVGCHSGLSADEFIPGALGASWAESLARAGASAYVAQSGFGYGSTDSIQLTERLLTSFASRLDGNYTIGEALTLAKNEYLAPLSAISVYDEKSLQQAILYGLPFSTPAVAEPPTPPTAPPTISLGDTDIDGLRTATLNPEFEIIRTDRERGIVFEIDGQAYAPQGQPLQPIIAVDATGPDDNDDGVPDDRLHGALLLGGVAFNPPGSPIDPVYNTPTINRGAVEPEIQPIDAVYPISPIGVSDATTEFGRRDFVGIQPGRFTATQPNGTGDQVLYDDLSIQTLHSASDDWTAPTVRSVNQTVSGGILSVTVATPDTDVAGVVVAVVENLASATPSAPALWRSFNLTPSDGRWSGGIRLLASCTTQQLEYLVQVFDRAGNVRVMSNKAAGFASSCADEVPPTQDAALQAVARPENIDTASGWYVGPVTVDITSPLPGPFSYRLDGGAQVALAAGVKQFVISGNGVRNFAVVAAGSPLEAVGTVRIDAGGQAPSIAITSPSGDVVAGSQFAVAFSCQDPSLVSCDGQLTDPSGATTPVSSGQWITAVAGSYTLSVTADDAVSTTGPTPPLVRTFAANAVAPEITAITGPTEPERIGTDSTVTIEFADPELALDEYTVEFDWGSDLLGQPVLAPCVATSAAPGSAAGSNCSVVAPTASTSGSATATVRYPKAGVYSVDVTVTDRSGLSSTATHEFVVIFDPNGGSVAGAGTFWSDPASYFGNGPSRGTFGFFGFAARYRPGSSAPVGTAHLRLVGGFSFRSSAYDYLVVNDTIAVTEGVGQVNGTDGYRMRVQGIDNGWIDFFQITIWNDLTGEVLYDNGTVYEGVPDDVRTDAGDRVLLGGIVVRR